MANYEKIKSELNCLLDNEINPLIIMSNSAALLYEHLESINWLGFYLVNAEKQILTLGTFQGKVACTRIPKGQGVCGTAWETGKIQNVVDVHQFPGHIACDSASLSEIVIPLFDLKREDRQCLAVLDIDSPILSRFSKEDETQLAEIAHQIASALSKSNLDYLLKYFG